MAIILKMKDELSSGLSKANAAIEANGRAVAQLGKQYQTAAAEATRAHEQIIAGARGAGGALNNVLTTAAGFAIANVGLKAFGAGFGFVKDSVVGFNDTMDKTRIALTSMLGSAQAADAQIREMARFARETPFEFEGLAQTQLKLLQVGFIAKDIIPTLTAVGDAVAASGRGAVEVDRVVLALTQMAAKGKVSQQELNQLSEAGVAGLQILAQGFHTSTGKMADMVEHGLVPADKALKILIEGMEARAPGAMDKMSHTASGAASNIHDAFQQLIGGAFRPAYDALVKLENKLADALQTAPVQQFAATVAGAFSNLTSGIEKAFAGDQAGARLAFTNFGQQATSAIKQVELALLTLADSAAPAVEPIAEAFASLVGAAAQWGADLIVSFANGIAAAASSVLSEIMSEVADAVASWIHFSKPDKGPLRDVEVWGAEMLTNFFKGASQADFSVLDDALSTVKDILTTQFNNGLGGTGSAGFIPALIGSEAAVAQAISDIKAFGDISEETLSRLGQLLGADAPEVADLIRNMEQLAGLKDQMAELDRQVKEFDKDIRSAQRAVDDAQRAIDAVDREIADLNRTFEAQKRPVQDALDALNRYYDVQERRGRDAITLADQQLAAIRRLHQPQLDQLTDDQRALQLSVDQQRLTDLQNAPANRLPGLQQDVASAGLSVQSARAAAAGLAANATALDRARAMQAVQAAELQLAQAQQRLAQEGHTTDADRLAIAQQQQRILEDQVAIEGQGVTHQRDSAQAALDELGRVRDLDPVLRGNQQTLSDMADDHERALRALQDQRQPLEDNLRDAKDHLQALQDGRQALIDQRTELEDQAKPLQDAIALVQTRFGHEKDISDELQKQLDLLNQQATAGGAGRVKKGAGAGGAGIGAGLTGAGLGLNIPRRPGQVTGAAGGIEQVEAEARAASARSAQIDQQLATLGEKVKAAWKKGITDGFDDGFADIKKKLSSDPLGVAIKIAVPLIDYKLFGPIGALIGIALSDGIVDSFKSGDAKTRLDIGLSGVAGTIIGFIFGNVVGAAIGAQVGAWAGAHIVSPLSHYLDEHFTNEDVKDWLISAFTFDWEGVWSAVGSGFESLGNAIKGFFSGAGGGPSIDWDGIGNAVSDRAETIGGAIVDGAQKGIEAAWDGFVHFWQEVWNGLVIWVKETLGIASPSKVFQQIGDDIVQGLLNGASDLWESTVQPWFKALPDNIVSAVGRVTETLLQTGRDVLGGLWKGVTDYWGDVVAPYFEGIGQAIAAATERISRAGTWLYNIGRAVIDGLWRGIQDSLPQFGVNLGSIKDFIADHKGPPAADRQILMPAGKAIIDGLIEGMKSKEDELAGYLKSIGDLIAKAAAGWAKAGDLGGGFGQPDIVKSPNPITSVKNPPAGAMPTEGQRIYTSPETYWEFVGGRWQQHSTREGSTPSGGGSGLDMGPAFVPPAGTLSRDIDPRIPAWDNSIQSQDTPVPANFNQQLSAKCTSPYDIVSVGGWNVPCYELMGGSLMQITHPGNPGPQPGTPITQPGGMAGGMGGGNYAGLAQAIAAALGGLTISVDGRTLGQVVNQEMGRLAAYAGAH